MADGRPAELAVQTEQRHQIDRRQCVGGYVVEVRKVTGVQAGGVHQVGVELLVNQRPSATAVFVELDRHERRLGLTDQPRDREGVRVGLFEVVQRAVYEVLAHLIPAAGVAKVVRRAGAVGGLDRQGIHRSGRGFVGCDLTDFLADRGQEDVLEPAAYAQQRRVPFPAGIDVVEAAVVQFIANVEGQLQVEAVRVRLVERNVEWAVVKGWPRAQGLDDGGGQRTDRAGQFGFDRSRRQSHM